MQRFLVILIAATALAVTGIQPSAAAELKGSLSGDLYSWNGGDEDHLQPYVSLRANLLAWKTAERSLSFHTYSRWKSDWQDKIASDPQFFVYDSYLKFKCRPRRVTIHAGRQFAYSAAGSAHLDGVRLKIGPFSKVEFDIFGGSGVSRLDPEKVESFSDNSVLGGQLNYQLRPKTRFGLGWMRRENDGSVSYHRLGINIGQKIADMNLYTRFSVNPEIWEPSEFLLRARHTVAKWYFSGEFLWRDPSVSYNSVFSLIDFKRYREVRFEARRNIRRGLAVYGNVRADFFSSENAWTTGIGVRTTYFTIGWVHQSGYGGDSDGLRGNVNYQFKNSWQVYGHTNITKYRIQEYQDQRSEAYSSGIGVIKRFGGDLQVRAEWQYLRNAVRKYDSRIHFRVTKGFAFR